MDRDIRINVLKIVCGVLQIAGLISLFGMKSTNPVWVPFLYAVIAVSGFAALVQMITDKQISIFGYMVGVSGCGLIFVALLKLAPQ